MLRNGGDIAAPKHHKTWQDRGLASTNRFVSLWFNFETKIFVNIKIYEISSSMVMMVMSLI